MKSPWLPPLYVEFEDTSWIEGGGEMIGFRVMKHGQPKTSELQFFKGDARQIITLLDAAGVTTRERVRGEPEKPWFKR